MSSSQRLLSHPRIPILENLDPECSALSPPAYPTPFLPSSSTDIESRSQCPFTLAYGWKRVLTIPGLSLLGYLVLAWFDQIIKYRIVNFLNISASFSIGLTSVQSLFSTINIS